MLHSGCKALEALHRSVNDRIKASQSSPTGESSLIDHSPHTPHSQARVLKTRRAAPSKLRQSQTARCRVKATHPQRKGGHLSRQRTFLASYWARINPMLRVSRQIPSPRAFRAFVCPEQRLTSCFRRGNHDARYNSRRLNTRVS